jgi:hypothetical protein
MNIFERTALRRFMFASVKVLCLLLWLAVVMDLIKVLSDREVFLNWDKTLIVLSQYAVAVELAVALAAPLGMIVALNSLKRSGILTLFLAAGYSPRRFRRVLAAAGLATGLFSLAAFELTARAGAAWLGHRSQVLFWKAGPVNVWALDQSRDQKTLNNIILFSRDSLQLSSADHGTWSAADRAYLLSPPTSLMGETIALLKVPPRKPRREFLFPVPLEQWLSANASLSDRIAGVNRIAIGFILLLLSAYLTLLLPVSRQWLSYLIFLFLGPATALGMLYCSILALTRGFSGRLAEAGWAMFLIAGIMALDYRFQRRGFRLN